MNSITVPEVPEIQISLLLTFLIKKFNDALTNDPPEVPLLLQGLGYAALSSDTELCANYEGLLSSPHLPPREIIVRAIEIFETALKNDPDGRSVQQTGDEIGDDYDATVCRQVLMTALREGKIMEKESSYQFHRVFELLAWIGLQCDNEWLKEFDAVRDSHRDDPENLVRSGRDILLDVVFRRRPSDSSCVSRN